VKSLFKNKKAIIITSIILLIAIVGGICLVLFGNKDNRSNNKSLKEGEYVAYVKINPLVKLKFKSSFYECEDKDGKVNLCEKFTNEVIGAEFLNDDAKSIYKDLDFKGKSLNDAIVLIAKTAEDKDYNITNIDINSNWNYIDNVKKEVTDQIKKETNVEVEIKFNYQKSIDESSILEKEKNKKYTVRFDSDGGTNVEDQTITENNKANKPADPTKKEYTFEGWYLDDKKYDFDSSVTKDITLKARWKKENTNNNNSSTNKPVQSFERYNSEAANQIFQKINDYRVSQGRNTLPVTDQAQAEADMRAKQIITNFSHNSSYGFGENIGNNVVGYDFFTAWKNSWSHNNAMLREQCTAMAVSVYEKDVMWYAVVSFKMNY